MKPLLPQQEVMFANLIEKPELLLAVDAGLGKTRSCVEAIKFLLSDLAIKGVLVVAPLRVALFSWPDELDLWGGLTYADLRTPDGMRAWDEGSADVYLINYHMLISKVIKGKTVHGHFHKLLNRKEIPADMIVWDESSFLKSNTSKTAKQFAKFRDKFKRHVGLSGTSRPNSVFDLFTQILTLDGGKRLGTSFHAFRNKYGESDYMGYSWAPREGAEAAIYDRIRDMTLVMRKEDWMKIPPTTEEDIEVPLSPALVRQYRKFQKDMLTEIEKKTVVALTAATLVQKLLQFTSGAAYTDDNGERLTVGVHDFKLEALKKLHASIGHKPLLVMVRFQSETPRILEAIPEAQAFDATRLDDWNAGRIPMWVASPQSMAHGLQMQGTCCHVCWFSLTYSFEHYSQGNSRVVRTGQKNPTVIYRLMVPDSIDWVIAEVLRTKRDGESAMKVALKHIKTLANLAT